jgi:hypothetical protein
MHFESYSLSPIGRHFTDFQETLLKSGKYIYTGAACRFSLKIPKNVATIGERGIALAVFKRIRTSPSDFGVQRLRT